ncbi:MAG: NUDIX hydrolase [Patescibacteria group bacterium]|nr:NUDIX hydrolase [Patescibacteria group bacterium]
MRSDFFPECFYRVTVKGLCVRDGKVLLVRESAATLSGKWELPGGGLDLGEDIHEGFKREIKEEMGLDVKAMSKEPVYVWTHRYEANHRDIGWYYSLVLAYEFELESLDFTPTEECEAIGFFSKEELAGIPLAGQTNELSGIFDPEDFIKRR